MPLQLVQGVFEVAAGPQLLIAQQLMHSVHEVVDFFEGLRLDKE